MTVDIYAKSAQLLESLANSIYDRYQNSLPNQFCFSTAEIHIIEKWGVNLIDEALTQKKD